MRWPRWSRAERRAWWDREYEAILSELRELSTYELKRRLAKIRMYTRAYDAILEERASARCAEHDPPRGRRVYPVTRPWEFRPKTNRNGSRTPTNDPGVEALRLWRATAPACEEHP